MPPYTVRRLTPEDRPLARATLELLGDVFEEPRTPLGDPWIAQLLDRPDFWLFAAVEDGLPIGGLTAHVLPMTRSESSELFIYDLAVHPAHQRRGVGRALVAALRQAGEAESISVAFVPADNEDDHALAFYRAVGGEGAAVTIFTFDSP